ncbi:hypothetical protein ACRALDRAFT_213199 [Sodiomyces alcalophilus JCM 7366]|uniref:uncharacterized protein n=1 Tax=Sodiomyces alcalophilus JCM 7366 TaxID=591952 RepID=UPI0039B676F6
MAVLRHNRWASTLYVVPVDWTNGASFRLITRMGAFPQRTHQRADANNKRDERKGKGIRRMTGRLLRQTLCNSHSPLIMIGLLVGPLRPFLFARNATRAQLAVMQCHFTPPPSHEPDCYLELQTTDSLFLVAGTFHGDDWSDSSLGSSA